MRKIAVLLAFSIIGSVFFSSKALATTTVYGFMNGQFYDVNGSLKYGCLMDGSCYDYTNQAMVTLGEILGLSTSTPQTITISDGNPTPPPPPQIVYVPVPVPAPAPVVIPDPTPAPTPVVTPPAPVLLPAYTETELATKLGVWTNPCGNSGYSCQTYYLNFSCKATSPTTASCGGSGTGADKVTIQFNGQIVADCSKPFCGIKFRAYQGDYSNSAPVYNGMDYTIDSFHSTFNGYSTESLYTLNNLTPNTDYSYQITYTESGRQDSVFTKSFTTPSN